MVVSSHIQQCHVSVLQLAVVRSGGMSVVKHGVVRATRADRGVGTLPSTAVLVNLIQEASLKLKLHHASLCRAHNLHVSIARDISNIVHNRNLSLGLGDARAGQDMVQSGAVEQGVELQVREGLVNA